LHWKYWGIPLSEISKFFCSWNQLFCINCFLLLQWKLWSYHCDLGFLILTIQNDILDNIFDNYLQLSTIFKNREALRSDYIPDYLPHRDEQIKRIASILAPILSGSRGSNILIYGKTGTGKTAVVRYVLKRLFEKAKEEGVFVKTCYINCRLAGTDYRVLAKLCESINIKVPFTGLATGEVFDRFKNGLEINDFMLIIVLDEIDALVKEVGDTLLYELTRINEGLDNGHTSLIGVSNDLYFKEFLDARVLSSLSEEEVIFRPYLANELYDILLERAKTSFNNDVLVEGALHLCSAFAAAEHGDARRALDLLRVAGELAERKRATIVSEDYIRQAKEKIEKDRVVEVLKTLPLHSKIVLCSTYHFKKANQKIINTGDVYEVYKELCEVLNLEPLTQRRVSSLINELDTLGILKTKLVSLGRYGRTKRIILNLPMSTLNDVYSKQIRISKIINHSIRYRND